MAYFNRIDTLLGKYKVEKTNQIKMEYCRIMAEFLLHNAYAGDNLCRISKHTFEEILRTSPAKKYLIPREVLYYQDELKVTWNNARWYLNNKYECNEPIWNGSFLHGITKGGKVLWSAPSLRWSVAGHISDWIKEDFPYGYKNIYYSKREYYLFTAPCLYLPWNEKSYSYLAGLLSCATPKIVKGKTFAVVNKSIRDELIKFGIPIEGNHVGYLYRISPIWPKLFEDFMPKNNPWQSFDAKPYNGRLYATLLWIKFIGNTNFDKSKIPFLESRRNHFYRYNPKKGDYSVREYLDRQVVHYNFVALDSIFKDLIREKVYGEKKESRYITGKIKD